MCVYEALMKKISELRLQVYSEKVEEQNQGQNCLENQQRLDDLRNFNKHIHIPDSKFKFSKRDFSNFFRDKNCYSAILAHNFIWSNGKMHQSPLIILSICTIDANVLNTIIQRNIIFTIPNICFFSFKFNYL